MATATPNGGADCDLTRLEGKKAAIIVTWFLGFGTLLAWNSMLTINDYYYQVFPKYHPSRVLTLVNQPFAFITMAILAYYEATINTRKRTLAGYTLFFLATLGLISLDLATSGKGGPGNYVGVCIFVACFGLAGAHVEGAVVGDLSFMSPIFIQSYFGGLAASGALTSGLRLVTKAMFDKTDHGLRKGVSALTGLRELVNQKYFYAVLFLSITALFELLCIFLYAYVFPNLPIVKYYRAKAASQGSMTVSADLAVTGIQINATDANAENSERLSNKQLIRRNIDYLLGIALIYILSLSIFPGFFYENTGVHGLGDWYSIVLVAMFNFFDLIGRYTPLIKWTNIKSRKGLIITILARFLLIPAFYFTAKYADQGWMILLVSFLGLTNGHLSVCIITEAPKGYKGPEQNALGNILVLFLYGGIFVGVTLDWLWIWF